MLASHRLNANLVEDVNIRRRSLAVNDVSFIT